MTPDLHPTSPQVAALRVLREAHEAVARANASELAAVSNARRLRCTWAEIGEAIESSRQGAYARWASKVGAS